MRAGNAANAAEAVEQVDGHSVGASDPVALLAARRARGDQRHDPVRFRLIEALARRTATQHGAARRILDARLAHLLAAYEAGFHAERDGASGGTDEAAGRATSGAPTHVDHLGAHGRGDGAALPERSALAALVEHIARSVPPGHEDTLRYLRTTWSRLSTERQLLQALATVPENAGPLNSHQLVHRSLALMRELSPAYLHRFMPYVDTLLWLDHAKGGRSPAAADAPRAEGRKKPVRGKVD